jgi:internalin A
VYYQENLFHDQIILDQRWAIEAIYSIFHRESTYRQLKSKNGRFQRIDLHDLVWYDRTEAEQRLFLSFMESCALCFQVRGETKDHEAEYIAPDLLPDKTSADMADRLAYRLEARGTEAVSYTYTHFFLHQATMRRFIVRLGHDYQDKALYWKDGLCIEPPHTQTIALIECERAVDGNPALGRITLEVRGVQRERVLNHLRTLFERLEPRHQDITQTVSLDGAHWVDMTKLEDGRAIGKVVSVPHHVLDVQPFLFLLSKHPEDDLSEVIPTPALSTPPPAPAPIQPTIYISYAWGDARETGTSREDIVDRLYRSLTINSYSVKRDKMDLGYKGLISEFMQEIGQGDLVVVVISDKYLKSPFCMYELLEISRNEGLHDRLFPLVLEDAAIRSTADCLAYIRHWKKEFDRLTPLVKDLTEVLAAEGGSFQEYKKYQDITQNADHLLTYLANINSQTPELLAADDFATLKNAIDERLQAIASRK